MGGMFSASDDGRGEATGGGTIIGSGVEGAEETEPRDLTSILGVWNSGEYSGEVGIAGRAGEPTVEIGGCQGHSTQCSQRDKCLFCGQTSPTSHCQ